MNKAREVKAELVESLKHGSANSFYKMNIGHQRLKPRMRYIIILLSLCALMSPQLARPEPPPSLT